jgi:hypothetical protein
MSSGVRERRHLRRMVALGTGILVLYLGAAALTLGSGHLRFLPLFDTGQVPVAYEWVKPPPQFAAGNVVPKPKTIPVAFSGGHSASAVPAATDGQFYMNIPPDAIALPSPDTAAAITISPLDPATLAPLPGGLSADGNAYRAQLVGQPSLRPIPTLTISADAIFNVPQAASSLFFSVDGKAWQALTMQVVAGPTGVGSVVNKFGYFVVGTSGATAVTTNGGSKSNGGTVLVAVVVAAALLLAAGVPLLLRSRRRKGKPPAKGGRGAGGGPRRPSSGRPASGRSSPSGRPPGQTRRPR